MKILMLSPTYPMPLHMGSKIRVYHSLRVLSTDHSITLLSIVQDRDELQHHQEVDGHCMDVRTVMGGRGRTYAATRALLTGEPYRVAKFHCDEFQKQVSFVLRKQEFDLVWVHFLNMLSFLSDLDPGAPVVLDQHNADELMWKNKYRHASFLRRCFAGVNLSRVKQFRDRHGSEVDRVLSVSSEDASFTRSHFPQNTDVDLVPNGVDLNMFGTDRVRSLSEPVRILFCGSMDVQMNIEAVHRFVTDVFPMIQNRIESVQFDVVGRNPDAETIALGKRDGIHVTGTVESVVPYYRRADIFVAPFQFGGGTKLKILEAFAARVPVVSSKVGVQGIDIDPGTHTLVEDEAGLFAEAVVQLAQNPELYRQLAEHGYELVRDRYSWDQVYGNALRKIEQEYAENTVR